MITNIRFVVIAHVLCVFIKLTMENTAWVFQVPTEASLGSYQVIAAVPVFSLTFIPPHVIPCLRDTVVFVALRCHEVNTQLLLRTFIEIETQHLSNLIKGSQEYGNKGHEEINRKTFHYWKIVPSEEVKVKRFPLLLLHMNIHSWLAVNHWCCLLKKKTKKKLVYV